MIELIEEQKRVEREAVDTRHNKEFRDLTKAIEQGRFDDTKFGNALIKTYFEPIYLKIQEYFDTDYKGHTGKNIQGEIYLVDNNTLDRLDSLEGIPYHYNKQVGSFKYDDTNLVVEATIYVKTNAQETFNPNELLDKWVD